MCEIFMQQYSNTLGSATRCMVQPTTIHNWIGCTLFELQGSLASKKNIATVSGTMAYVGQPQTNNYLALSRLATLVAYSSLIEHFVTVINCFNISVKKCEKDTRKR